MAAEPIRLHPDNPHYFLWRGRATVLIGSGEHYGAVLNLDFDYRKYLATLGKLGFNHTRTFSGCYCEPPGAFRIRHNTLAPGRGRLICPWARSDRPGYRNGGNLFDLTRWDEAYFRRLKDFLAEASRRGVVVELVLFCPFYKDEMWLLSPMNAVNNVNGIGTMKRTEAYTARRTKLLDVQLAMVRKIVSELRDFDNLYYEICNEPYFGGVTMAWQHRIAETIAEAEKVLPHRHLISRNVANGRKRVVKPHPAVSILNFHYASPPDTVAMNYGLDRAIGDNETGFRGMKADPYRIEAWELLLAGGALFSNLDYTFFCGAEDGSGINDAPGSATRDIHAQLGVLVKFINGFDFVKMRPDRSVVRSPAPKGGSVYALVEPGRQYAVYVRGPAPARVTLQLPPGRYAARWVDVRTGRAGSAERFDHPGGPRRLAAPGRLTEAALRLTAAGAR